MGSPTWRLLVGDCRERLRELEAGCVHTVVTSPPYFGLRDYGTGEWEGGDPACDHLAPPKATHAGFNERYHGTPPNDDGKQAQTRSAYLDVCGKCRARRVDRQIGLEPTPDEFVAALVAVFREVRRVLRDDGTVWLNLGDSYAASGPMHTGRNDTNRETPGGRGGSFRGGERRPLDIAHGCKPKDLLGIPWMVAFALRADGWYLRSDIVWSKPNPMPESVTDRPTKSHEYVFLLSKGPRYAYDADAIREPHEAPRPNGRWTGPIATTGDNNGRRLEDPNPAGRNKRSVWTVATQPYAGAHFATFPPKLIEPCVLAGAPERACGECGAPWVRVVENHGPDKPNDHDRHTAPGQTIHRGLAAAKMGSTWTRETLGFEPSCSHGDGSARGVVLDLFAGAGTTGLVALQHGRDFVGIELSPEYARMARERIETAVRLGFRPAERGPEPMAGQDTLFAV